MREVLTLNYLGLNQITVLPPIRIVSPWLIKGVLIPLISFIKMLGVCVLNLPIFTMMSVLMIPKLYVLPRRGLMIRFIITACFLVIILFSVQTKYKPIPTQLVVVMFWPQFTVPSLVVNGGTILKLPTNVFE
jgi:galactitol-specific phosphotransferase system IIC component